MDDAAVYEKYADELIRFATALVGPSGAEDVLANAVLRAFGSRQWATVEHKRAYLHRMVWTEAYNQRRATRRRLRREARSAPAEVVEPSLVDRDVLDALGRLDTRQRAVIYLTYWVDMPPADIAAVLHIGLRTVERDLATARRLLKEVLT